MSVHAGALATLGKLFSVGALPEAHAATEKFDHSANFTPLLSAHVNPDPLPTGGGDIAVAEGALVSTGPIDHEQVAAAHTNNHGEISVYTVREGDSLSQIAEMYGVTTNTIKWANDLKKATDIHPGQTLVILPIAGIRHTVAKGETLASIVKKYDANLDEVVTYNGLSSAHDISVGDELILPGADMGHVEPARRVVTTSKTRGTHTVRSDGSWLANPNPGAICTQGVHGYNGVDLASAFGSSIHAAAAGRVIISKPAGYNGGYGHYIVIKHPNGVQTLYAHLSANKASVGDWVTQGEVIGNEGSTGRSTGPHLHFEVRGDVNPFGTHCRS